VVFETAPNHPVVAWGAAWKPFSARLFLWFFTKLEADESITRAPSRIETLEDNSLRPRAVELEAEEEETGSAPHIPELTYQVDSDGKAP